MKRLLRIPLSHRRHVWVVAGYLCAYVALDWISYIYPVAPPLAITPWNPPPGLSLALLLRRGLRNTPWLFVAAIIADLLVRGAHVPLWLMLIAAALPTAIYALAAVMLRGALRFDPDFATLRDDSVFIVTVA